MKFLIAVVAFLALEASAAPGAVVQGPSSVISGPSGTIVSDTGAISTGHAVVAAPAYSAYAAPAYSAYAAPAYAYAAHPYAAQAYAAHPAYAYAAPTVYSAAVAPGVTAGTVYAPGTTLVGPSTNGAPGAVITNSPYGSTIVV